MLKLLQYCNYIIVMQIKLMLLLLLLLLNSRFASLDDVYRWRILSVKF